MDDASGGLSGLSADGLARIEPALQGVADAGAISGAVTLIWRDGAVAYAGAVGRRDIEQDLPMQRDTLFRIMSMSKPITSVAALMLMEEGKLSLDDPITRWAPEFADMRVLDDPLGPLSATSPAPRDITIDDLFTHRSGLAYAFTSAGPIAQAYASALGDALDIDQEPDAWMAALGGLPLSYPPGQRFHYSHATDVLGFIVGRAAGAPFRDFLMRRIFEPLGMADTDFWIPPEKRHRAARVYRTDPRTQTLKAMKFAPRTTPPAFTGGGGGLVSTADDYLKFARMLLGDGEVDGVRLLKPETVALMTTNRLTDAQRAIPFMGMPFWTGQGFGLGVSVVTDAAAVAWMGTTSNGAFTWPGAFGTWWQADPARNMVLVYLIQNAIDLGPGAMGDPAAALGGPAMMARPMFQNLAYAALAG
jgi:CubicO group peptidase (beta-lactamase class C family)